MSKRTLRHKYHIHKDNVAAMRSIQNLRDESGKFPFNPTCWDMITIIAGFGKAKGCYMALKTMAKEMGGRVTTRTLQSHENYLFDQGVISRFQQTSDGRTTYIRRIKAPKTDTIESVAAYRKRTGRYKYRTKSEALFLSERHEKFACSDMKNFPERHEKFSPNIEIWNIRSKIIELTPKSPLTPRTPDSDGRPSGGIGVGIRRPRYESCRTREKESIISSKEGKEVLMAEMPEPEPIKRKKKQPKNQRERRAKAIAKHNRGHIVNPLGGPDTRLRRMKPKLARDIGPTGSVTAAQLYRHLVVKYEEALGVSIEPQMPQGRDAIVSWFDNLRQDFLQLCGYKPTYRDLSEYFEWMLEPKRLERTIGAHKIGGGAAILKVQQFQGKVHIRTFYDAKLRRKTKQDAPKEYNQKVLQKQQFMDEFQDICDTVSRKYQNPTGMALCLARFGFPLVVQCLHDRHGMSEDTCKRTIIDAMARYVARAEDPEKAKEYLKVGLASSASRSYLYNQATLWREWKGKAEALVKAAVEKYEREKDGQEKEGR